MLFNAVYCYRTYLFFIEANVGGLIPLRRYIECMKIQLHYKRYLCPQPSKGILCFTIVLIKQAINIFLVQ